MFGKVKKVFVIADSRPMKIDYKTAKNSGMTYYDTREGCQKACDEAIKTENKKFLDQFPEEFKKTYIEPSVKEYKFNEGALTVFINENGIRNNGYDLCRKIFGTEGVSYYGMNELEMSDDKFLREYGVNNLWVKRFYETHELKGNLTFLCYKT